jgi:hypothetical protein
MPGPDLIYSGYKQINADHLINLQLPSTTQTPDAIGEHPPTFYNQEVTHFRRYTMEQHSRQDFPLFLLALF